MENHVSKLCLLCF